MFVGIRVGLVLLRRHVRCARRQAGMPLCPAHAHVACFPYRRCMLATATTSLCRNFSLVQHHARTNTQPTLQTTPTPSPT